jgi:cytochrome c biogenesis protein CcmG/thiol:disulfide interchange protein DsbE
MATQQTERPTGSDNWPGFSLDRIRWTRRSIIAFALTALGTAALLVLLWSRLLAANQAVATLGISPLVGRPAPDFTITLYSGYQGTYGPKIHLADLKGKPVVVNFWGSWCADCRAETPLIEAAWKKYQSSGIVFVGVDIQDQTGPGIAFLQQNGVSYLAGPDASDGATTIAYGVTGAPETAFISRQGIVVQKVGGALDDRTLDRAVQNLLKSP